METGQERTLDAVARLAGGIAHDLNNALLPLRAYGEIALKRMERGEPAADEVEEMLAAAERASSLTRQLLAFSGRQVLRPDIVDLNDLVTALEPELGSLLGDDLAIRVVRYGTPVRVLADRTLLEHVLVNLVQNARAATSVGGTVTVAVSANARTQQAELTVCDTGRGMDADTAAHLFEPFFTRGEGAGNGLGLAAAHGIVTQSGGTIDVETAPGEGAVFAIRLPLFESETADRQPDEHPPAEADGAVVLLVEDDVTVRASVERMLSADGYGVVAAAGGEEAIAIAADFRPDVVLTDVAMPGLNGRETAERIREIRPGVPVVFMSGYTDDLVLRRGIGDGATPFLQKPFGAGDLARAIDRALCQATRASSTRRTTSVSSAEPNGF
jgi:two-component system, cell cycle sensor histidine kinase and response regulator CckA